jgi:hypothetical protein
MSSLEEQQIVIQPKRKRGRPRKNKVEPKQLKKRGRKKKIDKQIINLNNLHEIEKQSKKIEMKSIIVHLPIDIQSFEDKNNKIFENDFLNYNPEEVFSEPQGFDFHDDMMTIQHEKIEKTDEKIDDIEYKIINNEQTMVKKINNVMLEFQNFNDKKYFQTDICCWHCCHKFDNMPCGIPLFLENDIFHVKGIFCSFNCALTYNYNSRENENIIQERESLLNLLYKRIHNVKNINLKHAPEKETLKMFGGSLTIDEFRLNNNIYTMIYPPMLSIIPQLEEIKIFNTTNESNKLVIKTENNPKKVTLSSFFKKK